MKSVISVKFTFKFEELSEAAKRRALEDWRNQHDSCFWHEEIFDSLKACIETAGLKMKNWEIGIYHPSFIRLQSFDGENLTGKRALAWLENNLLDRVRIKYKQHDRWQLSKYGDGYRAGQIKSCPFTGVCYDEDFIEALRKSIISGETIKEAFEGLASVAQRILENEYEAETSEEYLSEHAAANDYEFYENGKMA